MSSNTQVLDMSAFMDNTNANIRANMINDALQSVNSNTLAQFFLANDSKHLHSVLYITSKKAKTLGFDRTMYAIYFTALKQAKKAQKASEKAQKASEKAQKTSEKAPKTASEKAPKTASENVATDSVKEVELAIPTFLSLEVDSQVALLSLYQENEIAGLVKYLKEHKSHELVIAMAKVAQYGKESKFPADSHIQKIVDMLFVEKPKTTSAKQPKVASEKAPKTTSAKQPKVASEKAQKASKKQTQAAVNVQNIEAKQEVARICAIPENQIVVVGGQTARICVSPISGRACTMASPTKKNPNRVITAVIYTNNTVAVTSKQVSIATPDAAKVVATRKQGNMFLSQILLSATGIDIKRQKGSDIYKALISALQASGIMSKESTLRLDATNPTIAKYLTTRKVGKNTVNVVASEHIVALINLIKGVVDSLD